MPPASTQQFIEIAAIQEGVVILKNGSYRLILSASAINFSLKSEEEQNALIFQYQSFLNSLHFPIQVVIQSKRLDLEPYLKKITAVKDKQTNELLRLQTEDYIQYVTELIEMANIMKKTFYVVVPYDPINLKKATILDKLFNKGNEMSVRISDTEFKRYKDELMQRANITASGLGSMGLHCVQLTTEEIIELYYKIYNPEVADKERISDADTLTSNVIEHGKGTGKENTNQDALENEAVIDNSGLVEEKRKQEVQMREREATEKATGQPAAANAQPTAKNDQPAAASAPEPAPAVEAPANTATPPPAAPATSAPPEPPQTPPTI